MRDFSNSFFDFLLDVRVCRRERLDALQIIDRRVVLGRIGKTIPGSDRLQL